MSRKGRVVIPRCPHHIVHRGHNRRAVFVEERDYRRYLWSLRECKLRFGVKVYAYCLMTNHVHLVLDPGDDVKRLAVLMKHVAGGQTRFVNTLERRTGTLWESRFRSTPIDTEEYLLTCCRYVELNPVRAGITQHPRDYPWSSYRQKAGLESDRWVDLDPVYLGLGRSWEQRAETYEMTMGLGVSAEEAETIRNGVQRGQPTGRSGFVNEIAARTGRRFSLHGPGRPPKQK